MQTMSADAAAMVHESGVGRTAAQTWGRRKNVRRAGRETKPLAGGALPSTALTDPTPMIDRERELEVIRGQLPSDSVRLVTLMGAGGIGKTRLALAAARCVEAVFPDGVWFVELASLHDPSSSMQPLGAS